MGIVELLSPAGNAAIGRAAIEAGADAVYIGARRFGARSAAGNPMDEIGELARYAHRFGAKVYVTMNTLLFDDELEAARTTAWEAYEAGVDALIVQDMAFTRMELPPIALHASTQTFNLTPKRAAFLAAAGFSRIVVERGASLEQIRAIRAALPEQIELEAFVHGAICVCYSGQCYLGHALCGRGGNRGSCAQPCRARYDLCDDRGRVLLRDRPLLSVRDLNLGDRLDELIEAGVCSLKIEGRLKEVDYVVNNTAYYDRRLRALGAARASVGETVCDFEPNPEKSFSRGFTTYYWSGRTAGVAAPEARSVGESVGTVLESEGTALTLRLRPGVRLNNGDGLCFVGPSGRLEGASVNRSEGERSMLNKAVCLPTGAEVFRNFDSSFRPSARRTIGVSIAFGPTDVTVTDETGLSVSVPLPHPGEPAVNRELAAWNIRQAFGKSGGTVFRVSEVTLPDEGPLPFMPTAELNGLRRTLLDKLSEARLAAYVRPAGYERPTVPPVGVPGIEADYRANVANSLAEAFYRSAGVQLSERALEAQLSPNFVGREVMRSPYCLRRERGICLREPSATAEPRRSGERLFLVNNGIRLELTFHCDRCEMGVVYRGPATGSAGRNDR